MTPLKELRATLVQEGAVKGEAESCLRVDLVAFRHHLIRERDKATTVNRRIQSLRTLFSWLQAKGIVPENSALRLRFVRRTPGRRPLALNQREVLALLRAAGSPPPTGWVGATSPYCSSCSKPECGWGRWRQTLYDPRPQTIADRRHPITAGVRARRSMTGSPDTP